MSSFMPAPDAFFECFQAARSAIDSASDDGVDRQLDQRVSASMLVDYSRRPPGYVALHIERAIRSNPRARAIYLRALGGVAQAASENARAAADGATHSRIVGNHRVECILDHGYAYLLIYVAQGEPVPSVIEVRDPNAGGARIPLVSAVEGIIQRRLDPKRPEDDLVLQALGNPLTHVFLM